jgi:N utilization substance protein B
MSNSLQSKNTTKLFSKKFRKKRNSRILAIQCIYAMSINPEDSLNQLLHSFLNLEINDDEKEKQGRIDEAFLIKLATGTNKNLELLDTTLSQYIAKEWRFERLGKVIQAILRVGAFEILNYPEAIVPVVINEYLEIARIFNHPGEVGFINSVLDSVAKNANINKEQN